MTIAFTVDDELVTVLRVFTAGKNWETALSLPEGFGGSIDVDSNSDARR